MKLGFLAFLFASVAMVFGLGTMTGAFPFPIQVVYLLFLLGIGTGIASLLREQGRDRRLAVVAIIIALIFGGYVYFLLNFTPRLG